jgi:raffinose/stachyose/melibiose transport system permease protein
MSAEPATTPTPGAAVAGGVATTAERPSWPLGGTRAAARPPGEPRRVGYLYLLPAFAVFAAFVLWPLGHAVYLSLWEWDGVTVGRWAGLGNYAEVITDEALRAAFGHALLLLVFYALLPVAIGLVIAGLVARARVRGLAFFRTILFLPQVIAMVVVAVMWRMIYDPESGALNEGLRAIGLGGLTQSWLGDFDLALPSVGLIATWVYYGLAMVLLTAGVQKIPASLFDAARVDGAGPIREFLAVTLPALRGEIAVALTLTTIYALRNFDLVYITTSGGPGDATTVPAFEVYNRAFQTGQVGSAAAVGVSLAAIIFAISLLINRVGERGSRSR